MSFNYVTSLSLSTGLHSSHLQTFGGSALVWSRVWSLYQQHHITRELVRNTNSQTSPRPLTQRLHVLKLENHQPSVPHPEMPEVREMNWHSTLSNQGVQDSSFFPLKILFSRLELYLY